MMLDGDLFMIVSMNETLDLENQWPRLLACLPASLDLEGSARQAGLFQRVRAIRSAADLLRLIFAYALCGQSLKQTALWAEAQGIASISAVSMYHRFRQASGWVEHLLASVMADEAHAASQRQTMNVRLVDGSHVTRRGIKQLDWRLHLGLDLASLQIDHLELTDYKQGESLRRFPVETGDWVIGDAGYSKRPALWHVVEAGGDFIVRHNWQSVPLQDRCTEPFALFEALQCLPDKALGDFDVCVGGHPAEPQRLFAARLIAIRKSDKDTAKAQKRLMAEAKRKKRTLDPHTLKAAAYVLLLTSASQAQMSPQQVLDAYRYRWQVELAFKRLKSLVHLDDLPIHDRELSRTVLCARLIVAVLLDRLTRQVQSFSPSACEGMDSPDVAMAGPNLASANGPHRHPGTHGHARLVETPVPKSANAR